MRGRLGLQLETRLRNKARSGTLLRMPAVRIQPKINKSTRWKGHVRPNEVAAQRRGEDGKAVAAVVLLNEARAG